MSFAAVAERVVSWNARLITEERHGREQLVHTNAEH